MKPRRMLSAGAARVIAILLALAVCWILLSFFRFTPDDVHDFSTVTGTLLSAQEHITGGKGGPAGYLDVRLRENSIRYCVPSDGYLGYFRRKAFFAEVHKGATVQLTVAISEIATPLTFRSNSTPTIFVRGVRVEGRDYCTFEEHIAWQKRNNWSWLTLALMGSGLLVFLIRSYRLREIKTISEAKRF